MRLAAEVELHGHFMKSLRQAWSTKRMLPVVIGFCCVNLICICPCLTLSRTFQKLLREQEFRGRRRELPFEFFGKPELNGLLQEKTQWGWLLQRCMLLVCRITRRKLRRT